MEIVECDSQSSGFLLKCRHASTSLGGLTATFRIFLPRCVESIESPRCKVPVIYYLAGLSCNEDTAPMKCGGLKKADALKLAIVFPDTSPRGAGLFGEDDHWDFGTGAGFYLNATKEPWCRFYKMYDYIVNELPCIMESKFPVDPNRQSIMGHSMGGHGALTIGIKNFSRFRFISAFAPICHPTLCSWGTKAFAHYLTDYKEWKEYDTVELLKTMVTTSKNPITALPPILIDQGTEDKFLHDPNQLRIVDLAEQCVSITPPPPITLRLQSGYDHSYHFVAAFFSEHLERHAQALYGSTDVPA